MRTSVLLIATFTLGALACSGGTTADATIPPVADSATVARAQAAASALAPELAQMLLSEMQRGGPVAAVAVCADSAQLRTARFNTEELHVRRIGTRVRNPDNAPDSLETRLLAYLAEQKLDGTMPTEYMEVARTGADGGWELRYLRPILLQEFCATCHGARDAIPTDVRAIIDQRYPQDTAVDYASGDLRGAVAVRVAIPRAE
jgi:hypothetical protein